MQLNVHFTHTMDQSGDKQFPNHTSFKHDMKESNLESLIYGFDTFRTGHMALRASFQWRDWPSQ